MAEYKEIVKKLDKKFGMKLQKIESESVMLPLGSNGYVVDENGNIIGLRLTNLKIANISVVKELTALVSLNLSYNQILDISVIKELTALTSLNLSYNQILDISAVKGFDALTYLDLSSNQIWNVSALKELTALTYLNLSSNQIWDVTAVKYLKNLIDLYLRNNHISQLPEELLDLGLDIGWGMFDISKGICLEGNPLETPPVEIVKQGTEAVRNYFEELKGKVTIRLLESKLLIVGNGGVGKTSLMKKLKDNNIQLNENESSTHGINIEPWQLTCQFAIDISEKVKINFWDFGGQEIYHSTHQFFLTKRSLYLFVWEARKEEESRSFDYWLNIIKLLSDDSPVIVVMNKSDTWIKYIDEATFKDKFNNIFSFVQVSCLTGKGIPALTEQIKTALENMYHLRDRLPEVWLKIRDRLKNVKRNYIHIDDYYKICEEFGLDEKRAEYLCGYLHDLGVILHYRYDHLLENTVILNPEWATGAVYKIIDTRTIQDNKGRFIFDDLKTMWDKNRYPMEKHLQLARLMEKFELCFNITGTNIYIIPELLPAERPSLDLDVYRAPGSLHFLYQYDFMPEGIITRFICRNYYFIREEYFWKTGVELTFEDSRALVRSDNLNRKMEISVIGSNKGALLAIIRKEMEHIHHTLNLYKGKNYHEMLPCTCGTCACSDNPHTYKHKMLKMFLERGNHLYCQVSGDEVSIEKLLVGYKKEKQRHSLKDEMVTTASQLQGVADTIKEDEDSRNGFMALILSIKGFMVKDQTRWGRSATGRAMGRIDFKVEFQEDGGYAICEAFRLQGLDRHVIDSHLKKLFSYDACGVKENFIIVYAETDDLLGLWEKYLKRIPEIDFECRLHGKVEEEPVEYANIKLARARHVIEGIFCDVYHLFVKMPVRS